VILYIYIVLLTIEEENERNFGDTKDTKCSPKDTSDTGATWKYMFSGWLGSQTSDEHAGNNTIQPHNSVPEYSECSVLLLIIQCVFV
jgi:hypothetical protein